MYYLFSYEAEGRAGYIVAANMTEAVKRFERDIGCADTVSFVSNEVFLFLDEEEPECKSPGYCGGAAGRCENCRAV
jgi:hypothetical protein